MRKMYHVSLKTINKKERLFTPRIPVHICLEEDQTIPRICVCPTIEDALGATPYKNILVNNMRNLENRFITVYEFNVPDDYIWDNDKVRKYVPDAYLTNEHWIIKPAVANVKIINIKEITLNTYYKHADFYKGYVDCLEYEDIVLSEDKTYGCIFLSKSAFRYAKKIAMKNDIKVEVLDKGKNPFYCYDMGSVSGKTLKSYCWTVANFTIPSNIDATELIVCLNKENKQYSRLGAIPYNYDINEEEETYCS